MGTTATAFQVQHLGSTVSTMDDVRQAALTGADDGLVIYADEQTGGRGRRGRSWASPAGNLYASLLLRPALPQAELGLFSFATALGLAQSLPASLAPERVKLKWPNDVLADGAKVAGILLESVNTPRGLALIIGIGVNLASYPVNMPYPVTSLAQIGYSGAEVSPQQRLERLLPALDRQRQALEKGDFPSVRAAWLAQAANLGSEIVVRLPSSEMTGHFMGIDEKGHLLLRRPTGILQKIASGEVFAPFSGEG